MHRRPGNGMQRPALRAAGEPRRYGAPETMRLNLFQMAFGDMIVLKKVDLVEAGGEVIRQSMGIPRVRP